MWKELLIADALSCAPTSATNRDDDKFQKEVNLLVNLAVESLPASEKCLTEIKQQQETDKVCLQIKHYCTEGWHSKGQVSGAVLLLHNLQVAAELAVNNGLLM